MGRNHNFAIFDDHDSFGLIKKIVKRRFTGAKKDRSEAREGAIKNRERPIFFAQKISGVKNMASADGALKNPGKEIDELVLAIFQEYEASLKENNAFDFDDLIEKPVRLFKKYPEVLKKYQNKFDVVLVDEYQDLNPKQYELIKFLAGGHKNLSVVGDDEQMIYGWRHANLETFLNFEKDWPGAQIKFLEENYRSTQNIIGAAAAVVKNNQHRRPKNLWTRNQPGELIKIAEFEDENGEAEWIASEVQKSNIKNKNYKTAVLYRTNAQSRAIEQALIRHKIPYHIFGGLKFYERKEIKDIVAALRYTTNKKDELSRDRLEKNIGKRKFREFAEVASGSATKTRSPVKLIEKFLKTTGYFEYLEGHFINYDERWENVAELINFAGRFDEPLGFLEEIALVQSVDMPSNKMKNGCFSQENQALVDLMTIHLAKGLEFDRVFLAGCSEGLLPHARSLANEHQLEEERRLMYVAMTRARKELYLSFCAVPSRFLGEIPSEFLEFENGAVADHENEESISAD